MNPLGKNAQFERCVVFGMLGIIVLIALAGSRPATAQTRGARALRAIEVDEAERGWTALVRLDFPARYVEHFPEKRGRSLRIRVQPVDIGRLDQLSGVLKETLPVPRRSTAPISEVAFESRTRAASYVVIEFSEDVFFEVSQGADLETLRLRITREEGASSRARPSADPASSGGVSDGRASARLAAARVAIRDGELDRAIALLSGLLESDPSEYSAEDRRDARELLGLTRERRGQFAHARAEYELYLSEYPDGASSDRVRQRLEALVTASSAPTPSLRGPQRVRPAPQLVVADVPIEYDFYGGIGVRYFRTATILDGGDGGFLASDVLTDFDLTGRVEASRFTVRTDLTGTYDEDVAEGSRRSNDIRISRLSVHVEDAVLGLEATLGRQRRSDSGVLGRFDGLHLRQKVDSDVYVSALVGMPVESTSDSKPNTDVVLGGAAVDFEDLGLEGFKSQLFIIAQRVASMTGRAAVGGDLRYSSAKSYSFVYFDYDFLFQALNTAIASSTYYWTDDTNFRAQIERRTTPILELRTALQGQTQPDLDALRQFVSESDVRKLAKDRSQILWSGSAGVTHRLNPKLQLSADLSITHASDTKDVLDVQTGDQIEGATKVGPNVSIFTQLLLNDWLVENGVGSVSARYFEGDTSRAVFLSGFGRIPITKNLRASPRIQWEWRSAVVQSPRSTLRPSIEFDWRGDHVTLNAEGGIEWVEGLSSGRTDRKTSYYVQLGARWSF